MPNIFPKKSSPTDEIADKMISFNIFLRFLQSIISIAVANIAPETAIKIYNVKSSQMKNFISKSVFYLRNFLTLSLQRSIYCRVIRM